MKIKVTFLSLIFLGCTQNAINTTSSLNSSLNANSGYFGYYASQMDGIGVTADMDELKSYSNFVFIHSGELEQKLQRCRDLKMKAFVSFSWLTFNSSMRLFPDWQTRIQEVLSIMDKYQDVIIANYILDEPYLNGARAGVSVSDMYTYLETLGQFFKARYPQMPLAVIFSAEEMNKGFKMMPSFDWFGMDCYGGFYKCGGSSIPAFYTTLKTEMDKFEQADGRKRYLMAVPPSGFETNHPGDEIYNYAQIADYRNYLRNEPRFKVIIPFLWQTFTSGTDSWTGTRDSAKLKPAYQKFYQDFISGNL